MRRYYAHFGCLLVLLLSLSIPAFANILVRDDMNQVISLTQPANRIIALSPHLTELVYAAGAGSTLKGVSRYSDYPASAKQLPIVNDAESINYEAIIKLRPDLILVWKSGLSARKLNKLSALKIPIYVSEPEHLIHIAKTITDIGKLAGTSATAVPRANQFTAKYQQLVDRYHHRLSIRVLVQIWDKPLIAIGGNNLIDDAIGVCGGRNIFSNIAVASMPVSPEAVLARNPQVIILSDEIKPQQNMWQRWSSIDAVQKKQIYQLPADTLFRYTPRMLDGIALLCQSIDKARS